MHNFFLFLSKTQKIPTTTTLIQKQAKTKQTLQTLTRFCKVLNLSTVYSLIRYLLSDLSKH